MINDGLREKILSVAENRGLFAFPSALIQESVRKVAALPTDEVSVQKNFARLRSKPTTHPPHSGPPSLAREG